MESTDTSEAAPPREEARTRRRRRRWPWAAGALLLVAAWAGLVATTLLRADHRLRAGIAAADAAKSHLSIKAVTSGAALADLQAAARDFSGASAAASSALLAPLDVVPVAGTQLRSVSALSKAASTVSEAGAAALSEVRVLLGTARRTGPERAGIAGRLSGVIATLAARVDSVTLGPSSGLLGPLAAKRATFAADLSKLRSGLGKARGATAAVASLLRGPSTYLVFATNNAEMRAGSGMMLEVGTITSSGGNLRLGAFRPTGDMVNTSPTAPAPSGDLAARWGFEHPAVDFRELMLSPQFPPNAALAARMWQAETGQHVSGVIALDVVALRDIVAVTGAVNAGHTRLDAANVVQYLLEGQYAGLGAGASNNVRTEHLGQLAGAVFHGALSPSTSLSALGSALDHAAAGRHLMVWSATPAIEADWQAAGVGGSVSGDEVLASLLNQGVNKLDPFQQVTSAMAVSVSGSVSTVTITLTDHNTAPTTLSRYASGGPPGPAPPLVYAGAMELDFPAGAGRASVLGATAYEAAGRDYGSDTLAVAVRVPDGASVSVTFRFELAGRSGRLLVMPSARVPSVRWTAQLPGGATQSFEDSSSHAVSWTAPKG